MPSIDWSSCDTAQGAATLSCIPMIFATIIAWALFFSGAVAAILIIVSGIRLITSSGDATKVEQAKKTFTYAIAGLVLIFISFLIVITISQITGVACINPNNLTSFTSCS